MGLPVLLGIIFNYVRYEIVLLLLKIRRWKYFKNHLSFLIN